MVSEDVYENMRSYATKRGQDISAFAEEALSEKIAQCKELEKAQEEMTELRATVDVARRLYQQIQHKPDFSQAMAADFIKTITSGIDPKYHDIVVQGITEKDKNKVDQSIARAMESAITSLTSNRKFEISKLKPQNQPREEQERDQKVS